MAGEIQLLVQLQVINGTYRDTFAPGPQSIDQALIGEAGGTQTITETAAQVSFSLVTTAGLAILQNVGVSNIQWGAWVGGVLTPTFLLKPGEAYPVRLNHSYSLGAKCDTGETSKLRYKVYEN